ncbi:MAG: glycosyltransferase family 4 protein [bacterium]|nr:glycosyltransferase family 4 protein [bacterium]
MRILHLISSSNIGGSPIHTLLLCQELEKLGCKTLIISPQNGSFESEIKKSGIEWIPMDLNAPFRISLYNQLSQMILQKQIDIIHTHELKADFIGFILAWKTRRPLITTIHNMINKGPLPNWKKYVYICLTRLIATRQNKIIAVSDAVRHNTIDKLKIPGDKVITIRNGTKILELNPALDKPSILRNLGLLPNKPVIALISRLIPKQKGHTYFLQAAKLILKQNPKPQFLIIGDGTIRKYLEVLTQQLGIQSDVHFVGWQHNIFDILQSIDICVVPSLWDPLPRIVLEAMAAGIPVVASNVDGIPEAVIDGVTGILVPPANAQRLADACLTLLNHPEKAKQMGYAGRNRAIAEFSSDRHAQEVLKVYEEILSLDQHS